MRSDKKSANPLRQVYRLVNSLVSSVPKGRLRFWFAVGLAALASGASVALMGTSAWLLSRAAEHPPVLLLQVAIVGVRFFGISRGVFRYFERLFGHELALRMQGALRVRSYQALSNTTLLGKRKGDLLVRVIADVDAVMDMVVRVAVPFCSASLVILGTTIVLSTFNLSFALVLLATAVLAGIGMPALAQMLSLRADQSVVPARGKMGADVRELARTATDLVAYGRADQAILDYLKVDLELERAEARSAWARAFSGAGQMLATGIAVVSALLIGGAAVASGNLLGRDLAVLVLVPLALHEVFSDFNKAAQTLTRVIASLKRVNEVLETPPVGIGDRVIQDRCDNPVIKIENASFGWPDFPPVVENLSFSVKKGEKVALTGVSGSGKTTIAATIMGLIPPLAGKVEVSGRVGYLAQDAHIFATSLAENVLIGNKDATAEQVQQALHSAGLDLDPDRIVGEDGASLSGGEVQRVALARVLVGQHDLWILDEPSEHLDRETADSLIQDLWKAAGDSPLLVISHDQELIARCERNVHLT